MNCFCLFLLSFLGVLDFYFFTGYSPDDVIGNYHDLIGRPTMPPYWALGFHQCRWGYKDLQEVKEVVSNFASNNVSMTTDLFRLVEGVRAKS